MRTAPDMDMYIPSGTAPALDMSGTAPDLDRKARPWAITHPKFLYLSRHHVELCRLGTLTCDPLRHTLEVMQLLEVEPFQQQLIHCIIDI
jgi:hypothetical protein